MITLATFQNLSPGRAWKVDHAGWAEEEREDVLGLLCKAKVRFTYQGTPFHRTSYGRVK